MISTNSFYDILGKSDSSQLDYQVIAINGYTTLPPLYGGPPIGVEPGDYPVVIVNTSGWSSTQTITIPENQTPTPSPATKPTPNQDSQQTEQAVVIGVAIAAVVIIAGLGFLATHIKRK